MIRTEAEYQAALIRTAAEKARLQEQERQLAALGLEQDELKRALDPLRSFFLQLEEEIDSYERLRRGDLGELSNLHGLGQMLVALRVARGLTQRQLAARLGAHESQVSRDERNEYHGVTVDRATRVLDAMGVELRSFFERPVLPSETKEGAVAAEA